MTEGYYTETFITERKNKDNVIISLWHYDYDTSEQVGVAYVTIQQIAEAMGMTVDITDPGLQDLAPLKRLL